MPFCYRVVTAGLLFSRESCDRHEFTGNGILLPVYSGGIFRIASGVKLFRSPGYGWNIFIGIFDLLIAGVWLNMDPDRSYVFTSIFIGVEMIFSSLAFISLRRNATLVKTDKLADKN